MQIRENYETPQEAKEIQLLCPNCGTRCIARFPYKPTSEQRINAVKAVIDEHRVVCPDADATQGRTYQITYPRKR